MSAAAPVAAEAPVPALVSELSQMLDSIQEEVATLTNNLTSVLKEEGENVPEEDRPGPDGDCSPLARELYAQHKKAEDARNALRRLRQRLTV